MQSRDTKNLNFDKDFDEIFSKLKQTGWNESTKTKDSGSKTKMKINKRHSSVLKSQMESHCTL